MPPSTTPPAGPTGGQARWDVAKNAPLKLQSDHIRFGTDSHGTLTNIQSDFKPGGEVNVISGSVNPDETLVEIG